MDKKSTFYFLFLGTFIMIMIMRFNGKPLVTPEAPAGIINLELANTQIKAKLILNSWSLRSTQTKDLIVSAKINTYLDFIFLFFYSLFLYAACRRLGNYLPGRSVIKKWLNSFAFLALLCGLLDVAENIGMLITLNGMESDAVTLFTAISSIIKWVLVAATLITLITGLLVKLTERKN